MSRAVSPRGADTAGAPALIAQELYALPKSGGKAVRVRIASYKGSAPYLDVREWYRGADGEMRPGNRGVTIPLGHIEPLHSALHDWLAANPPGGDRAEA